MRPLLLLLTACAHVSTPVQFQLVARKTMVVPLTVGNIDTAFVFDSGAGITLVDDKLCAQIGCKVIGQHIDRKPSGQPFTVPLVVVPQICFGTYCQQNVLAGALPMADVQGVLSLAFFKQVAFTIDYARRTIALAPAAAAGDTGVALRIEEEGPSLRAFVPISIGSVTAQVCIDTSAGDLVLDSKLMGPLGIDDTSPDVHTEFGKDPTGSQYVRYSTTLQKPVQLTPWATQTNTQVLFQSLIYDGLLGQAFLRGHRVTYDLPHSRLIVDQP